MPEVSICIPTYVNTNERIETLKESIRSALSQTFTDIEVIVVCDASPINLRPHLECFDDPRLEIYYETKNLGITGNVIRSISYASGGIIKPLCDDDSISDMFIEHTIPLVRKYGFVVTGICHELSELNSVGGTDQHYQKGSLLLKNCPCTFPCHIFTREVYESLGGYDRHMYHFDFDFAFLAFYTLGGYYFAEKLCFFRRWDQSSSTVNPNIYLHYSEAADTYAKLSGISSRLDWRLRAQCIWGILITMLTMIKRPQRLFMPVVRAGFIISLRKNASIAFLKL